MLFAQQLDRCIDASISRLSTSGGQMVHQYFFDLRLIFDRQRVTQKLIADAIQMCHLRGLDAYADQMNNLQVTVDLNRCHFTPQQSFAFDTALAYTREVHQNQI